MLSDGYRRATILLAAGGERPLVDPTEIQTSDVAVSCIGDDEDGWGVAIAWEPGAAPAVGDHPLDTIGMYPEVVVGFPKPSGGFRFKFVSNGALSITGLGADFIEGTFDGIQFTVDDADDLVSGVVDGSFRCEGAL
jgi:hypothetical protein